MSDQVQKLFVKSFIRYLKHQIDGELLAADALESLEVAVQCLQAAFDLGEEEESQQASLEANSSTASESVAAPKETNIDLFEVFQSLFIERNPQSLAIAEQVKNEGNRLMKEGKHHEALIQYNRAITFDPKNPIFYCNRAAACIRLGENERAVRDCKAALSYNPNYSKAYGRMGIAYSNLGQFDEAQAAYSKAIELEPDNQDYRTNLEVAKEQHAQAQQNPNLPHQLSEVVHGLLSSPACRELLSDLPNQLNDPARIVNIFETLHGASGVGGDAGGASGLGGAGPNAESLRWLVDTISNGLGNLQPGQNPNSNNPSSQPPPH